MAARIFSKSAVSARSWARIMSAPERAPQAAAAIVKVINAKNPKLFNQVDFKSKVFLGINNLLPQGMKDAILLRTMNIRG